MNKKEWAAMRADLAAAGLVVATALPPSRAARELGVPFDLLKTMIRRKEVRLTNVGGVALVTLAEIRRLRRRLYDS